MAQPDGSRNQCGYHHHLVDRQVSLLAKAKAFTKSSKLTQKVSRGRLVRGFKLRIRKHVEWGEQAWKTGDKVKAGIQWAEAGSYYAKLLEVFG